MTRKRGQYSSPNQRERQQRILQVARDELATHGVAALTMKRVAGASNVALKTLYNIFGNRDGLLVKVVVQMLDELEERAADVEPEPGIQQLLAYSERGYRMLRDDQELAAVTIRILFQAGKEDLASSQIGRLRKLARFSLLNALRHGELVDGVNIDELSDVIASNQWGLALMWDKGLLSMDDLGDRVLLSHCLTLIPVCRGQRREWLEMKVRKFMNATREAARA